ncbi:hypothetical protein P3T25_008604 [Paraburkholderia sp. GAS32]
MTPNPPRWPATKVAPTDAPHLRALTSLVTSVVVIFALDLERVVLVPITLAVLLSFLAAPLVDLLRRLKQGQLPSVVVAVLLALTLIAGVGTLLGAQIAQLATEAPQYQAAIEKRSRVCKSRQLDEPTRFSRPHQTRSSVSRVLPGQTAEAVPCRRDRLKKHRCPWRSTSRLRRPSPWHSNSYRQSSTPLRPPASFWRLPPVSRNWNSSTCFSGIAHRSLRRPTSINGYWQTIPRKRSSKPRHC